jgi:hypothetical protein
MRITAPVLDSDSETENSSEQIREILQFFSLIAYNQHKDKRELRQQLEKVTSGYYKFIMDVLQESETPRLSKVERKILRDRLQKLFNEKFFQSPRNKDALYQKIINDIEAGGTFLKSLFSDASDQEGFLGAIESILNKSFQGTNPSVSITLPSSYPNKKIVFPINENILKYLNEMLDAGINYISDKNWNEAIDLFIQAKELIRNKQILNEAELELDTAIKTQMALAYYNIAIVDKEKENYRSAADNFTDAAREIYSIYEGYLSEENIVLGNDSHRDAVRCLYEDGMNNEKKKDYVKALKSYRLIPSYIPEKNVRLSQDILWYVKKSIRYMDFYSAYLAAEKKYSQSIVILSEALAVLDEIVVTHNDSADITRRRQMKESLIEYYNDYAKLSVARDTFHAIELYLKLDKLLQPHSSISKESIRQIAVNFPNSMSKAFLALEKTVGNDLEAENLIDYLEDKLEEITDKNILSYFHRSLMRVYTKQAEWCYRDDIHQSLMHQREAVAYGVKIGELKTSKDNLDIADLYRLMSERILEFYLTDNETNLDAKAEVFRRALAYRNAIQEDMKTNKDVTEKNKIKKRLAATLRSIGNQHRKNNDYEKAITIHNESINIMLSIEVQTSDASDAVFIAEACQYIEDMLTRFKLVSAHQNKLDDVINFLISLTKQENYLIITGVYLRLLIKLYLEKAEYFKAKGDYESAIIESMQAADIWDKIPALTFTRDDLISSAIIRRAHADLLMSIQPFIAMDKTIPNAVKMGIVCGAHLMFGEICSELLTQEDKCKIRFLEKYIFMQQKHFEVRIDSLLDKVSRYNVESNSKFFKPQSIVFLNETLKPNIMAIKNDKSKEWIGYVKQQLEVFVTQNPKHDVLVNFLDYLSSLNMILDYVELNLKFYSPDVATASVPKMKMK